MIDFGREWCINFSLSGSNEWLVTNGLGGYASGTVAGQLSRRYHGMLIAPTKPPLGRKVLVSNFEETIFYGGKEFHLYTRHMESGGINPKGFKYLERFHLEGTSPVWTFSLSDTKLEKRIWMEKGSNTTYVQYSLHHSSKPMRFRIRALINFRDHHSQTKIKEWNPKIKSNNEGIEITPESSSLTYYLLSKKATLDINMDWVEGFHLSIEAYRGLPNREDLISVGEFVAELTDGETFTIVATTDQSSCLDGDLALTNRQQYEQQILDQAGQPVKESWLNQLNLTADQFIVQRAIDEVHMGHSIIAGYPWFGDWGRDTMISLPGLTLATGRESITRSILLTYAQYIDHGMLPNNFPDIGDEPIYNTVDASLWYFEAIRAYYSQTGDDELLAILYSSLKDIIEWHTKGTRHNIKVDPADGLIYAGEEGVQLTWMDAKVDNWVVTPRIGKAVEINALWYNALFSMVVFADRLGKSVQPYLRAAEKTKLGFGKFWNNRLKYCKDVIDGPNGDDESLRPNQLIAVSIYHSPLNSSQQRDIVDVCSSNLLTPFGLRSLAPSIQPGIPNPEYVGSYGGNQKERDAAYHQGTVWGWLIGPFISAHLRAYNDPSTAKSFLLPLIHQISNHGLGSVSEIFDGDPPFTARGCISQAWSVAEVLRVSKQIDDQLERKPRH